MGYKVQQSDIEILYQKDKKIFVKVELLNKNMLVVDTLQGELISDNFSIDANSDIRRTYDAVFCIKDSSFLIGADTKVWLDKYLRIYSGIKSAVKNEIVWYPIGIFLFNEMNYSYDSTTKELSLSCVDLMSMLNDTFSGVIMGATSTTIPAYTNNGESGITLMDNCTSVLAGTTMKIPIKNKKGFVQIYSYSGSVYCTIEGVEYINKSVDHRFISSKDGYIEVQFTDDCNLLYISVYYDEWWNETNTDLSDDTVWTFKPNDKFGAHPKTIKSTKGQIDYYKKIIYDEEVKYIIDTEKGSIQVDGTTPVYSYIRDAMIKTVEELGGIKKYIIKDIGKTIPYDLEFNIGSTVYDIIEKLRDLYPGWETFFDVDGTFICQKYPTCYEDRVELTYDVLEPLVISESFTDSFSEVRNITEVFGQTLTANYYTEVCEETEDGYLATFEDMTLTDEGTVQNNILIGIKLPKANKKNPVINIKAKLGDNYIETGNLVVLNNDDAIIDENKFKENTSYIFKSYRGVLYYLGQNQIHALAIETEKERTEDEKAKDKITYNCENIIYMINKDSPFTVEKIGERKQLLNGESYELIYADDLAMQRAEYENWKSTRLQDSITLEMLTIPWLDVNKKVEYKSFINGEINQYIIKSIKGSTTSGTMTVEMMRFYPEYIPESED